MSDRADFRTLNQPRHSARPHAALRLSTDPHRSSSRAISALEKVPRLPPEISMRTE